MKFCEVFCLHSFSDDDQHNVLYSAQCCMVPLDVFCFAFGREYRVVCFNDFIFQPRSAAASSHMI
jgi:hypothetical protein